MQKSKLSSIFIYSYIALPFIVFASGFLKWYFALPVTLAVILSVLFASDESEGLYKLPFNKKDALKVFTGLVFIVAMVLLSGIGNVLWQNNDHATRNTLFNILSNYTWPPTYITDAGNEVGIVYYIGFWLPSALIAKLTSLDFGYIFQIIWATSGLLILWYLLCLMHKRIVIYPIVIFLFFGGMDIIGSGIIRMLFTSLTTMQKGAWAFPGGSSLTTHIEWWANYYQYSSHTTQLFWVFNQCIPVWIATVLLIIEKNNKNLIFIMGLTLLSSTLPFVGLIPVFLWCAFCDHEAGYLNRPFTKDFKKSFLSLFTIQNVIGGGLSGIISFLYLIGNIATANTQSSQKSAAAASGVPEVFSPAMFVFVLFIAVTFYMVITANSKRKPVHAFFIIPLVILAFFLAKTHGAKLELYFLFILLEFIVLVCIIYPAHKGSSLLFIATACLLIIPFFKVGKSIDFCMRASIPLLVVLCLFAIKAVEKYFAENRQILATLLCVVLMLGAMTPVKEIARTVEATAIEIQTKGKVENDNKTEHQVFGGKNFTGRTEGNLFFEIFAK